MFISEVLHGRKIARLSGIEVVSFSSWNVSMSLVNGPSTFVLISACFIDCSNSAGKPGCVLSVQLYLTPGKRAKGCQKLVIFGLGQVYFTVSHYAKTHSAEPHL